MEDISDVINFKITTKFKRVGIGADIIQILLKGHEQQPIDKSVTKKILLEVTKDINGTEHIKTISEIEFKLHCNTLDKINELEKLGYTVTKNP